MTSLYHQAGYQAAYTKLAASTEAPTDGFDWKPWATGAASLGAGLGTYGLLRRFRPSANPELRAIQNVAKDKQFAIATGREPSKIRQLLYGAKEVPLGQDAPGKVVLHHHGHAKKPIGDLDINAGNLTEAMHDKLTFDKLMREGIGSGPGIKSTAEGTRTFREAVEMAGNDPEKLKQMYPEGYLIKPREGSMSHVSDFVTEQTPMASDKFQTAARNADSHLIQERLPIDKEFRVHSVAGEPFSPTHRFLPHAGLRKIWNKYMGGGGGAFVPAMGKEKQELLDFVRESQKHMKAPSGQPLAEVGEAGHMAFDVAKLQDGTYRLIEANPTPGTLMNPLTARKLQQMVTGRVPKDVAALGGLGAAGLTAGAGSELSDFLSDDTEKAVANLDQ